MPFNREARSLKASKQLRDKNGHFYSPKPKVKISGQTNLLSDLVKTEDGDNKGSSWMTLTINHPFRKIIEILDEIRKKQSTRVNLSMTIPLVALPVVILMAFQFGRYQSSCADYFSSQVGILQNITVTRTFEPDHWFFKALSYIPFVSGIYDKQETVVQPVLIKDDSQGVIINNEAGADLDPFTQAKIIVFGNYNSCSETLTLDSPQNISNY